MYRSLRRLGRSRKAIATTIITIGLSCLLALLPLLPSAAISVAEVPNPQHVSGTWVTDMADLIDPATEELINQEISKLEAETGAEMAVVTVLETRSFSSPKAFATELFNTWGIGKAGEDNGVLFLVSKGDRRTEVETGYGVEGLLSDAKVGNILDTQVTPQFKAGNFGQGILSGTQHMAAAIQGVPVANTVPTATPNATPAATTQPQPAPLHSVSPYNPPHTNSSKPHQQAEPTSPSGFTKLLWVLLLGTIAPVVVVLRRLRQGKIDYSLPPVKVAPIGQSHTYKVAPSWLYLWTITLIGEEIAPAYPAVGGKLSFRSFDGYYRWNEQLAEQDSWLAAHHRSQYFNRQGGILFGSLFVLSLTSSLLPFVVTLEIFAAWIWLCYEIEASKWASGKQLSIGSVLYSILLLVFRTIVVGITVPLIVLFSGFLTGGLLWVIAPSLFVATIGTLAGLIRIVRTNSKKPRVICETCNHKMQTLSSTDLVLHVTGQQQAEIDVGSLACEGWHCQTCVPISQHDTFDKSEFRLFFFKRKKKGIKKCRSCKALTLEVTTQVISRATTRSSGSKRVTRHCHACGLHKEKLVTIPRKSSGSGSGSSYSGSSYSGGSSSSSSSSSSSGGSFGGGSSGGGGAGSSW